MATPRQQPSTNKTQDAIAMLIADHKNVKALFKQFSALQKREDAADEKGDVGREICMELTIHAQVEEEVFYPAVRSAIDDDALVDEAEEEHAEAKQLIAQIKDMQPTDSQYDAAVTELQQDIEHHVEEEEGEMFIKVRASKLNTIALGKQMVERKRELKAEMGVEEDDED